MISWVVEQVPEWRPLFPDEGQHAGVVMKALPFGGRSDLGVGEEPDDREVRKISANDIEVDIRAAVE
jgi:hypothetical protein